MSTFTLDQDTSYDLRLTRGQRYTLRVEWEDSTGASVDFSARTSRLQIVATEADWDPLITDPLSVALVDIASDDPLSPNAPDGSLVHDATGLDLVISSDAADRLVKSIYPYHLWIYPDDRPLLSGLVRVRKG